MAPNSELTSAISSALSTEKSPGRDFVLNRLLERQLPQFDALLESMKSNGELGDNLDPEMLKISFLSMMWQPFVMKDLYEQVFGLTVDEHFMARLADHNCRLMENGLRGTLN